MSQLLHNIAWGHGKVINNVSMINEIKVILNACLNFCFHVICCFSVMSPLFFSYIHVVGTPGYTPGIYAEGYIVFVLLFVCSYVRSFVLPSVAWNLRQSFALKFLKWCISQQLLIRKHSYLDHSYPGGLAFTP